MDRSRSRSGQDIEIIIPGFYNSYYKYVKRFSGKSRSCVLATGGFQTDENSNEEQY